MNINKAKYFFLLGIGGIGISALARYFNSIGKKVFGYDKISTNLTIQLEKEGISIIYYDNIKFIPNYINNKNTIIIFTSAIHKNNNNKLMNFFISNFFYIKKRSEILGLITNNSFSIAISGTHGKTTTAAILSHIFKVSGINCTSFIGGILKNYNSNFILGNNTVSIVEADEYDKSFLELSPNIICITSIDNDHLDIYKNYENIVNHYKIFCKKIKTKGKIFINKKISHIINGITYSTFLKNSNYYSNNILKKNKQVFFTFHSKNKSWENIPLPILGEHNLENTTAAISIALNMNIKIKNIISALSSFKGIERRFAIQHLSKNKVYIDDYAHHPTEIDFLIKTVKNEFPYKKILGIFQPHLFSRTFQLLKFFVKSLNQLDSIILLDIYTSREINNKKITSKVLLDKINIYEKKISSQINIINEIKKYNFDILLTIGAGDIDKLVIPIKNWLDKTYNT